MFNAADCRKLTVEWRCHRHGFWNSRPRLQWTLDMANEVRFIRHHMLDASRRTIFQLWRCSWNNIFIFKKIEGNFQRLCAFIIYGRVSLHYRCIIERILLYELFFRLMTVSLRSRDGQCPPLKFFSLACLVRRIEKCPRWRNEKTGKLIFWPVACGSWTRCGD